MTDKITLKPEFLLDNVWPFENSYFALWLNSTYNFLISSLSKLPSFVILVIWLAKVVVAWMQWVWSTWKKFHELLPILSDHCISFERHGYVYNSCVHSVMLSRHGPYQIVLKWQCHDMLDLFLMTIWLHINDDTVVVYNKTCLKTSCSSHLMRMENDIWPKWVITVDVHGKNQCDWP